MEILEQFKNASCHFALQNDERQVKCFIKRRGTAAGFLRVLKYALSEELNATVKQIDFQEFNHKHYSQDIVITYQFEDEEPEVTTWTIVPINMY